MKPKTLYPAAVGVLIFGAGLALNALHIAEHSVWRAALVGGLCAALVFWLGPKLLERRP